MTKGKLSYQFRGSLGNNDERTLRDKTAPYCGTTQPALRTHPLLRRRFVHNAG